MNIRGEKEAVTFMRTFGVQFCDTKNSLSYYIRDKFNLKVRHRKLRTIAMLTKNVGRVMFIKHKSFQNVRGFTAHNFENCCSFPT